MWQGCSPLIGIDAARLVDVDRPVVSKKRWPPVHMTGRQAPIDEPTLKRYALNAALLRYLAHRGVADVTDAFGQPWDESVRGQVADKKRWNILRLPAPRDTLYSPNAVCTLTFAFDMQGGDYKRSLFAQTKGANMAGIDTCFEQATAVYTRALGRAFGARARRLVPAGARPLWRADAVHHGRRRTLQGGSLWRRRLMSPWHAHLWAHLLVTRPLTKKDKMGGKRNSLPKRCHGAPCMLFALFFIFFLIALADTIRLLSGLFCGSCLACAHARGTAMQKRKKATIKIYFFYH